MESINLNLIPTGANPVVHVSQYDTGRVIRFNIFEGSSVYFLDGTETISCNIKKPDNNIVTLSVTNTNDSYVEITTTEQATACDGSNLCEISITKGDDVIGSLNFIMEVERSPIEGGISSASEINNLWTQVDGMVADILADSYDSANVVFDNLPTAGHGIPYTVTSEGIGNAIDDALDMTDTASGAIATFESEYALPLRDLEIEINAVQESGTPTPSSPKAISGFTGANITQAPVYERVIATTPSTQTSDGITVTTKANGLIEVNGTASANGTITFNCNPFVIPSIEGRIMRLNNSFSGSFTVRFFNGSTEIDYWALNAINRTVTNYSGMGGQTVNKISIAYSSGASVTSGTLLVDFIANSTTTAITWQSEAGTVYGGSLDVTSGVLTVTHALYTFVGANSENWANNGSYFYRLTPTDCKTPFTIVSNNYLGVAPRNYQNLNNFEMALSSDSNNTYINIYDNRFSVLSDFIDYISNNNLQVLLKLKTPVTYQLTPTQISAIVGTNNVFTDTNGDTSLEYYTKRGEQTVRIAEGVAVDVINNKSIDTLNTTDKTVKGAINELETKKANGWTFVNETLGNADINLPTGWKEILAVCRYGNGGGLQPQAVSIVITPEQKGLYMTAGASTILAQVVVSADTTKVNMTYFGVSGTEYTSDSQIRVWYR